MSKDWLGELQLNWKEVFTVVVSKLQEDTQYVEMFKNISMGITGYNAHVNTNPDTRQHAGS